jgi:fatty acid kinase fatty acid binding subunit
MNRVGILTESMANIPPYLAAELRIEIVRYHVIRDGMDLRDGVEVQAEEFAEYLASSPGAAKLSTTAVPSPDEYAIGFRALAERTHEIVALTTTQDSTAAQACCRAARQVRSELPDLSVEIVDTAQVGMAHGWAAIEAARLAAKHGTLSQVAQRAREVAKGAFTAQSSSPHDHAVILEQLQDRIEPGRRVHLAFIHFGAEAESEILRDLYFRRFNCIEELTTPLSPALAVHSGPGTVGVCFFVE